MVIASPPTLATIHVTEDAHGLFVRIACEDVHVRRALIDSFRQTFGVRRYSQPCRPGWRLDASKRARLQQWLATEQSQVQWHQVPG